VIDPKSYAYLGTGAASQVLPRAIKSQFFVPTPSPSRNLYLSLLICMWKYYVEWETYLEAQTSLLYDISVKAINLNMRRRELKQPTIGEIKQTQDMIKTAPYCNVHVQQKIASDL
jgi:hypothetical protein